MKTRLRISAFLILMLSSNPVAILCQTKEEVSNAMKKASIYMIDSVSNRGGFLWTYSADLKEGWGEITARNSQIWVQPPGTADVGALFLDAYNATGDGFYLECAERTAGALISGQHPAGGWHYFIDFDPAGIERYYEEIASKCWGWEEFYHYYGNCTFDDDVHTTVSRFLLDLYRVTRSEKYGTALNKAIQFVLESQYENGAWPQRYPTFPDYTSYYTYNDNVIHGNILFLLEAAEKLNREDYRRAAAKGMDFYIISRLPLPQAGWALQYSLDLKPAAARNYEPESLTSTQTVECLNNLMSFYKITGDRKYLTPIPGALEYLKNSIINTDASKGFTHATFYEVGTNKPLYAHREGEDMANGRYWVDYEQANFPGHYGMLVNINVEVLEKEYLRVASLSPADARSEY